MAGLGVRLFTDEHIFRNFARALRQRGYDVEGCHEAGRANQGISDEEQLAYATRTGRAILTENHVDFIGLDVAWKAVGRKHGGMIVVGHVGEFGELLRHVQRHLDTYPPDVQHNTLLWLGASPTR